MPRQNRVLSFMSEWGGSPRKNSPSTTVAASQSPAPPSPSAKYPMTSTTPNGSSTALESQGQEPPQSPASRMRGDSVSKPSSRPMSMIQTYQPPVMDVTQDTLPELQRIFTFLNSHSNKLYQEGYFLKFHDTDSRGRPAPDRVWQECFAQLVGTILSLWDASELDTVGGDAEVLPTFINLTDAAIHMMPSMVLNDGKKLENVLSVSTAASNKYLFHFNSFNSLTQWTAGIRLAMYEHTTLQEAYTGALIAGKGKSLNNIRIILDRQRAKHEDWARVRFGAGTPWRRCWCVVDPPDEKEYAKLQKAQKKLSPYNRSQVVLKGSVKFYDTNKIKKKTRPIATVTEAFACYAIYPQSKPLIDQSTLVKIEGRITIHAKPDTVTEGFVFVMPESHPAVSGFEIMLRFLFPVFDTFALYGRPQKLIADVLDTRGLMFAMPPDRRYGYLEMWDVVSLIHTAGSQNWSERQWRKQLKELTSKRMLTAPSRNTSRASRRNRTSMPPSRTVSLRFAGSTQSQPSTRQSSPSRVPDEDVTKISKHRRTDSAPPASFKTPRHQRSVSEAVGYKKYQSETPSRLAQQIANGDFDTPPAPPEHRQLNGSSQAQDSYDTSDGEPSPDARDLPEVQAAPTAPPSGPVDSPPSFTHAPSQRPPVRPYNPTAAMGPNTQMDSATLDQLADATHQTLPGGIAAAGAAAAWRSSESLQNRRSGDYDRDAQQGRLTVNGRGLSADQYSSPSRSGHSGNRLPTIPASPYVEQPDTFESHPFQPAAPPVPEHRELPTSQRLADLHDSRPGSSENVIYRKPVPGRSSQQPPKGDSDDRSTTSSSLASLRNNVIDPDALDSLEHNSSLLRSTSKSSSRYDDDAVSTSTPDYASTVSEEVQPRTLPGRREDRPRSGMLKTIGNRENAGDEFESHSRQGSSANIPTIDFGPTYVLTPGTDGAKRPGTSGTMTQMLHDNELSRSKENLAPSPGEQKRHSWLSGRTTPIAAMHMRSNSASPNVTQEARTIPWQPGMAAPISSDNKQKLDPEEWVAKRASAISPIPRGSPVYTHGRSKSHTPPPLSRNHSGDWSQLQRTPEALPARPPSRPLTMMQRPSSRGASQLLVDQRPTSLSAREQEQVARVTGTPLLDLHQPDKNKKPQEANEGLTAYIGHREREKAAAKASWNTAAVQAEIDRRMTAAQQRQMQELQQQQIEKMQKMQQQAQLEQLQMERIQMEQHRRSMTPMSMYAQPAYAYSSPDALHLQQQNQNYFSQPMQSGWGMGVGSPGSQTGMTPFFTPGGITPQPQMTPGYAASAYAMSVAPGQNMGPQQNVGQGQQQQQRPYTQPYTQPYGASFDQAQAAAAARFAHQQQQQQQQQQQYRQQ